MTSTRGGRVVVLKKIPNDNVPTNITLGKKFQNILQTSYMEPGLLFLYYVHELWTHCPSEQREREREGGNSDGRVMWSEQSSVGQIDRHRKGGGGTIASCLIGSEDGC